MLHSHLFCISILQRSESIIGFTPLPTPMTQLNSIFYKTNPSA